MISRIQYGFDDHFSGDEGSPLQHLEGILSVLRNIYKIRRVCRSFFGLFYTEYFLIFHHLTQYQK